MVDPSVCYENSSVRNFIVGESLMIVTLNPSSTNQDEWFEKNHTEL